MTDTVRIIASEHKNIYIGNNCAFSFDVTIRNNHAHLIYSCNSLLRTNWSESVYIGDQVWCGQQVTCLKGTQIDLGAIVGAASVVTGKKLNIVNSFSQIYS